MFWKVTGFSQPSPIEQILDKDEFTLEELLEEDDIVQECKSLNGRLVAFLRERSTVEQLIKYLVEPAGEHDDPKRTYKYPFTACEVFCCEVEAVYNTLLEDADLMRLLFSLLDAEPPLDCKTAGYFGRVVGQLLLRKTNEMMQYCQENPQILERLCGHIDTMSIADIVKRFVGADEHSSILFMPAYAQWLADTPLVELLLQRLAAGYSSDVQTNAAEVLSAIAHTQPSPLASKLTHDDSIATLFQHALQPGKAVLVAALDVCTALVEPKRSNPELLNDGSPMQENARRAKAEAVGAVVAHLPSLVALLQHQDPNTTIDTTYGQLAPPLGRAKLKVVELLSALLRSGDPVAERGLIASNSVPVCLELFRSYPFNNLLHHSVMAMVVSGFTRPSASEDLLPYLFEQCRLLDWISSLPIDVVPLPRAGEEAAAAARPPLRAGYLGHVTQIGSALEAVANGGFGPATDPDTRAAVEGYLLAHEGWLHWQEAVLHPRQDLENTAKWQCGRPAAAELGGIDSDGDEYQNDMDLGEIQGMQPALYHRYNVVNEDDEDDEEDDDEAARFKGGAMFDASGEKYGNADIMTEALSGMDINDPKDPLDDYGTGLARGGMGMGEPGEMPQESGEGAMDDDAVLLATSDEDDPASSSGAAGGTGAVVGAAGMGEAAAAAAGAARPNSLSADDMVIVDDDATSQEGQGGPGKAGSSGAGAEPAWNPSWPAEGQPPPPQQQQQ